MIELIIADDHTMFREGLKQLLAASDTLAIKGEARNGVELFAVLGTHSCDVVLLDMTMPGRSGVAMIRDLRREYPDVRILVLSMHEEQQFIVEALKAGANGYVTKNSAPDQLILGIQSIAAGNQFVSASASEGIIRQLCDLSPAPPHTRLSYRERQVLDLIVAGKSVSEIADTLSISIKTASTHKRNLMEKLDVTSTAALVHYAIRHELAG